MQPPTTQGKTRWSRKKKKVMSNEARRKQAWYLRTVHHLTLPHAQSHRAALDSLAAKAIQHQGVLIHEPKLKYGLMETWIDAKSGTGLSKCGTWSWTTTRLTIAQNSITEQDTVWQKHNGIVGQRRGRHEPYVLSAIKNKRLWKKAKLWISNTGCVWLGIS